MLTSDQQDLLIGGILGDCYVERPSLNSRVLFDHSIAQLQYVEWKHAIMQPYSSPIVTYSVLDPRNGNTYNKVRFRTATSKLFNPYRELFYPNQTKIVPPNIKHLLTTELALAVWYLDDGGLRTDCDGLRLYTNSFSYGEVVLLGELLLENFGIASTPHKQGKGHNLYIGTLHKQSEKFCDIIRPVVASEIPSMLYKLL